MGVDTGSADDAGTDPIDAVLEELRSQYVAEHDVEPPKEFLENARQEILSRLAKQRRDEHRDVYDALAEE